MAPQQSVPVLKRPQALAPTWAAGGGQEVALPHQEGSLVAFKIAQSQSVQSTAQPSRAPGSEATRGAGVKGGSDERPGELDLLDQLYAANNKPSRARAHVVSQDRGQEQGSRQRIPLAEHHQQQQPQKWNLQREEGSESGFFVGDTQQKDAGSAHRKAEYAKELMEQISGAQSRYVGEVSRLSVNISEDGGRGGRSGAPGGRGGYNAEQPAGARVGGGASTFLAERGSYAEAVERERMDAGIKKREYASDLQRQMDEKARIRQAKSVIGHDSERPIGKDEDRERRVARELFMLHRPVIMLLSLERDSEGHVGKV